MGYGQIGTAVNVGMLAAESGQCRADAPPPEAPLSSELSTLIHRIAEIEQAMAALQNRLAPVSVSSPMAAGTGAEKNARTLSPVVDAIRQSNDRLRGILAHVNIIANDLQV